MNGFKTRLSHSSVNLCGREVTMTEKFLQHAQIGTVIKQMGGKGVAQGMW